MKIHDIIWKQEFVDKLATKHGVEVEEVEDVLNSGPHVRKVGKGRTKGEGICGAWSGRWRTIFDNIFY